MSKLSEVIAALRYCLIEDGAGCDDCPYDGTERCVDAVMADALELLDGIPKDCHTCMYEDNHSGTEPCWSCGSKGDEPPSNWRWKYDTED